MNKKLYPAHSTLWSLQVNCKQTADRLVEGFIGVEEIAGYGKD